MKNIFLFLIVFAFLAAFTMIKAATLNDVTINEIAWMGTTASFSDEWIELFNRTDNSINIDGWELKSGDDKLKIILRGAIAANSFYLLERTDDNSAPLFTADLIYKGALSNYGLNLNLYDNLGNIIDQTNFSSGWPFGNNETKQTMERVDLNKWQTSQKAGGTPKEQNSPGVKIISKNIAKSLPDNEKSDNNIATASVKDTMGAVDERGLNSFSQEKSNEFNPWFLFLITVAIVIASAIVFLVIKFKMFRN